MRTVWKFPVEQREATFTIEMPASTQVLCVQMQTGQPMLWALVDPDAPLVPRKFTCIGTGTEIDGYPGTYVGTFQTGYLVWHLFQVE